MEVPFFLPLAQTFSEMSFRPENIGEYGYNKKLKSSTELNSTGVVPFLNSRAVRLPIRLIF